MTNNIVFIGSGIATNYIDTTMTNWKYIQKVQLTVIDKKIFF